MHRIAMVVLVSLATLSLSSLAHGQADTALARKVYADINGRLAAMTQQAFTTQLPGVEYHSKVRVWRDAQGIHKIAVIDADDDGDVTGEYFFDQGQLVFYFGTVQGYKENGKKVTRTENRQYFRENRMFKWLAGMGANSGLTAPASTEFIEEERSRLAAAAFFLKVANAKSR